MSDARFERGGGCWKGRKIADIMEDTRITGIRELYNISETGNQPFSISSRSTGFNEGEKKYAFQGVRDLTCGRREKEGAQGC